MRIKNIKITSLKLKDWETPDRRMELCCFGEIEDGGVRVAVCNYATKEEMETLQRLFDKAAERISQIGE